MAKINNKNNIGVFGFGNMGKAIFKILAKQHRFNFFICSTGVKKIKNAVCLDSLEELADKCDLIFLCVKPQDFYNLKPLRKNHKTFISIMAGVKIANVAKIVKSKNVIRVMPNLPLQIGQGVIAWHSSIKDKNRLNYVKKLFIPFGYSFPVRREADLDKITAISGSGPAYVFLFLNALIKAALKLGFDARQSKQMVSRLINGSMEYFEQSDKAPEELIKMVKSKKGTTEAALNKLNTEKFYSQWQSAVNQAHKRAKELSAYEIK